MVDGSAVAQLITAPDLVRSYVVRRFNSVFSI